MIPELIEQLRKLNRREAEHRTALEFAYEIAAGRKAPPERIAKAIEAAGITPEDFGRLVETAKKRAEARRHMANMPALEAERDRIRAEIATHNRRLEEAEEAHANAVVPLDARDRQIGKQLNEGHLLPGWLVNTCPVREIVEELQERRERLSFIEGRQKRLRHLLTPAKLEGMEPSEAYVEYEAFNRERFERELAELEAECPKVEARITELERLAVEA